MKYLIPFLLILTACGGSGGGSSPQLPVGNENPTPNNYYEVTTECTLEPHQIAWVVNRGGAYFYQSESNCINDVNVWCTTYFDPVCAYGWRADLTDTYSLSNPSSTWIYFNP